MNARLVFTSLLILGAAGTAQAQSKSPPSPPAAAAKAPAPTTAGCLLVSNAFANSATDEKARTLARASLYFFMGRVENGTTAAQLKAAFAEQERLINNDNATEVMNSCLKLVQAKSDLLASVAEDRPQGK
jgi:hypothetical protein